jgi:hypothetical protein
MRYQVLAALATPFGKHSPSFDCIGRAYKEMQLCIDHGATFLFLLDHKTGLRQVWINTGGLRPKSDRKWHEVPE